MRRAWRDLPAATPVLPVGYARVHALRAAAVAAAHHTDCSGAIDRAEAAGAGDARVPDATGLPPRDAWMDTWGYFR